MAGLDHSAASSPPVCSVKPIALPALVLLALPDQAVCSGAAGLLVLLRQFVAPL